jgi:hypothetical protein
VTFQVPHKRPDFLIDECIGERTEGLDAIIAKPDSNLVWHDYNELLNPWELHGEYCDVVYFFPVAFDYMLSHDGEALDMCDVLVRFAAEFEGQLKTDKLFDTVRVELKSCLDHWTRNFEVVHFDEKACEEKGWRLQHMDYVKMEETICEFTCELIKHDSIADLALDFTKGLANHAGDPIKASWFLQYSMARNDVYKPPEDPEILEILSNKEYLKDAAEVVLKNCVENEASPTYWNDAFRVLEI